MAVPELPASGPIALKVVIVGGGIGGLAAAIECKEKGFEVVVLESTKQFTHVGAGVFLGANVTQIATHMGIREEMEKYTASYQRTCFFTYDGSKEINRQDYHEKAKEMGYPLWQMHRADVHIVLEEKAREIGVEIIMDAFVPTYYWKGPSVTTKDGVTYSADLVICADGYKSPARTILSGLRDALRPSGLSAFRFLVPIDSLKPYPELAEVIDWTKQMTHVWTGPGAHALCYPIRQGKVLNVVLNQKELRTSDTAYVVQASPNDVKERYKGWDSRLQTIFDHTPEDAVLEWRLCDIEPMDNWIFPGGKMVLLGDACHAMLPTAAQGAGMSIEDGVAVAELLARIRHRDEIPSAMQAYNDLRTPRCGDIVRAARGDVKRWHKKEGGVQTDWSWSYDIRAAAQEAPIVIRR